MIFKLAYLGFLYFMQGLPYGLQDKVIPIYLRGRGLSYTQLTLARFLLVPWLCKALYAPVMDRWLTKHTWLSMSLLALSLTCICGFLPLTQTLQGLSIVLLLLNTFSAIQDVSVDAIAIDGLQENELGLANTVQVVGYKIGAICGGSLLFWLQVYFGLGGMFLTLSGFYSFAFVFLLWMRLSRRTEIKKQNNNGEAVTIDALWKTVFASKDTWSVVLFVVLYKLGEGGALYLLPLFLVDHGVPKESVVFWNGLVGQGLSLAGSALGGTFISSKWDFKKALYVFCALRMVPMTFHTILVACWPADTTLPSVGYFKDACLLSLCVLQLVGGAVTTAAFSVMMLCSQKQTASLRATHYSFLASSEVLGKLFFVSFLGSMVDTVGFPLVFLLLLFLMGVVLAVIPTVEVAKDVHQD